LHIAERRTLLRFGDALAVVLSVVLALRIWAFVATKPFDRDFIWQNRWWFGVLIVLWFILATVNDFYDLAVSSRLGSGLRRLIQITLQLLIIYLVIFFLSPRDALPRLFILYYSALSFICIALWRSIVWRWVIRRIEFKRRALIVGTGWAARTIVETLHEYAANDYEIVGIIGDVDLQLSPIQKGDIKDLLSIAQQEHVTEIVLAYDSTMSGDVLRSVMDCYEHGLSIVPMPILYETITGRVPIEHVGLDDWKIILPIEQSSIFNPFQPLKRLMDIGFSSIGLAIFIVMFPWLALAIRLETVGSIFYTQERIGKAGKIFKIVKLRTMIQDAEKEGPQWATDDDQRVTRVGRFLRKTRLDELPQFINILRGDMSLVGPRAERPFFVEALSKQIPFYRTRHVVRPGATGWAQIRYPYGNSTEDSLIKLQYDLYYIRHQSLAVDLLIILRTIGKMLSFSGT
jgi:exopolysaccharide biosynthesis polyprenyl glycosylphosphotransferase